MWNVRWNPAIADIDERQWQRLAAPLPTPLLDYRLLHALEASGSISPARGWQPCHLTLCEGEQLIGAAPLYIKYHSDGEFVFDHGWAQLAAEEGIAYYPKLVGMIPATPAVGYRFLAAPEYDEDQVVRTMLAAIDTFCRTEHLTGVHFNFLDDQWYSRGCFPGYMAWHHQSYLWRNPGFTCFDDYLAAFKSSARRNIRRELQSMTNQGIAILPLTVNQLNGELAELMYRYYLDTNTRYGPWAARFLYGDFFSRIFSTMPERLLVMAAYGPHGSEPLALSLLLHHGQQLIGRYWGCREPLRDLHFNMCYYAPLSWAIERRLTTVDPGAGSPHKIARGFQAVTNASLHRFYDPRLSTLFSLLLEPVNLRTLDQVEGLNRQLPFARNRH